MRTSIQVALCGLLCMGATGCHHRPATVAVPLPPVATVPLEKVPEPPLVAKVPLEPAPPVSSKQVPVPRVKKTRRKVAPVVPAAPAPAPVEVASSGVPPAEVIGALTAGGVASPAKLQEAVDLLAALDKQIAALPDDWKQKKKDGLIRVRYFQQQAQAAVKGGDGEGAMTLATKAKLLLGDLTK